MKCPQCQRGNPENRKFCNQCGASLAHTCPECGSELDAGSKYCGKCGCDLSSVAQNESPFGQRQQRGGTQPGERRYATVLFSDLSGYAAMNETARPRRRCRR